MNINVYNQTGEKVGSTRLSAKVFGIKPKENLIHQVVTAYLARQRRATAHAKTRGEVRGGGRKPWRQKGTGRARAGSIRSPIWRGGGVTFGPRNERNYKEKINKKMKKQVMSMVLSDKASDKKFIVLEDIKISNNKTKEFNTIIQKLPIKNQKSIFVYHSNESSIARLAKNIPNIKILSMNNLNVFDLLKHPYVLLTKKTLKEIEKKLEVKK